MKRRSILIATAVVWSASTLLALATLTDVLPMLLIPEAVFVGASYLGWKGAVRGSDRWREAIALYLGVVVPLWICSALCVFSWLMSAGDASNSIRPLVERTIILMIVYPAVGLIAAYSGVLAVGSWGVGSVRAAALHGQLRDRGYHWVSLGDCGRLWRLCGEDAFLLPPWADCATLPGVNEGDLESLARVAKLRREARREARTR